MKAKPEYVEGKEAWTRFDGAMKSILAVPHSEMANRIEVHRAEAERNPHKRGPKATKKAPRLP